MDEHSTDMLILLFARRWEPYGGADASEILICFGLSDARYRHRLHRILTATPLPAQVGLDSAVHSRLVNYTNRSSEHETDM